MKIPFCSLVSVKKKSGFLDPHQIPSGVYSQGGLLMGLGVGEGSSSDEGWAETLGGKF